MKAALVLLLAGAFATSPPHDSWTLAHARHVLIHKAYDVTDTSVVTDVIGPWTTPQMVN